MTRFRSTLVFVLSTLSLGSVFGHLLDLFRHFVATGIVVLMESSDTRTVHRVYPAPLPLPFYVKGVSRAVSAQSGTTLCATPTPDKLPGRCWPFPNAPRVYLPLEQSPPMETPRRKNTSPSPSIRRGPGANEKVPVYHASGTLGKLYERRYPPVPKTNTIYTQAKKAEYDGDFEAALRLYSKAIEENDRPESAIKDYAGLLHMRGNTAEAIEFMEARSGRFTNSSGYQNLLKQMKESMDRASGANCETTARELSRTIFVAVDDKAGVRIEFSSLSTMFPNSLKISRLIFINPQGDRITGNMIPRATRALIEFASHSAARKALMINKHESIKCYWAPKDLIERCCQDSVVLLDRPSAQLVKGGPSVEVKFAAVPHEVVEKDWPTLLLGSSQQPHSGHSVATPSTAASSPLTSCSSPTGASPLSLPIVDRRFRPREMEEFDDCGDSATTTGECVCVDWCLDTPSPIRHMACLI